MPIKLTSVALAFGATLIAFSGGASATDASMSALASCDGTSSLTVSNNTTQEFRDARPNDENVSTNWAEHFVANGQSVDVLPGASGTIVLPGVSAGDIVTVTVGWTVDGRPLHTFDVTVLAGENCEPPPPPVTCPAGDTLAEDGTCVPPTFYSTPTVPASPPVTTVAPPAPTVPATTVAPPMAELPVTGAETPIIASAGAILVGLGWTLVRKTRTI